MSIMDFRRKKEGNAKKNKSFLGLIKEKAKILFGQKNNEEIEKIEEVECCTGEKQLQNEICYCDTIEKYLDSYPIEDIDIFLHGFREDEDSFFKEENRDNDGLYIINVDKKRDDISRYDLSANNVKEVWEVIDYSLFTKNIKEGCCRIPIFYKDTDCELIVDNKTTILVGDDNISAKAIVKRPDKYIRCIDDSDKYPLFCFCLLNDYYFQIFDNIKDIKEKREAIAIFSRLSSYQQEFIISMSKRPKEKDSCSVEGFSPIRNEDALKMMYQLCRDTYSSSIRARTDGLFEQLTHSRGTDREDLLNQISYSIGINTKSYPKCHKSFDEIIAIMDKHIYGMEDLKIAIAEFIIAMQYSGDSYCAILLLGPPGVGKTSVCDAIAECMNIPLVHIDCSGVDTVTMSGLIKSYGGAKASKVMDAFYEVGRTDVLMLFDEIDKMVKGKECDPYGALIKPLGPQRKYYDEYIAGDTDVSSTKFVATANDINKIPGYILNRFEGNIFIISPYSVEEKVEIARSHIVPKKLEAFRMTTKEIVFSDDALYTIAHDYCSDEGVRMMSGCITKLIRKAITERSRGFVDIPIRIDSEYVRTHIVVDKQVMNITSKRQIGFL